MLKKGLVLVVFLGLLYAVFVDPSETVPLQIIENAKEKVVAIYLDEDLKRFSGSGFFIDADGHIITNQHVIFGADTIWALLRNGQKIELEIVKFWYKDMVILRPKIPTGAGKIQFPFLEFAGGIVKDEPVAAIGHSGNLMWRVMQSRIDDTRIHYGTPTEESETGQQQEGCYPRIGMIEYFPVIDSGFSGGPLINKSGKVVGINVAKRWFASYAISLTEIFPFLQEFYQGRASEDLRLIKGILMRTNVLNPVSSFRRTDEKGVWVAEVFEGGPAEHFGIKPCDIIAKVGNRWVNNTAEFEEILKGLPLSIAAPSDIKAVVLRISRALKDVILVIPIEMLKID